MRFPFMRWCPYGCWNDEGTILYDRFGHVVYEYKPLVRVKR